MISLIWAQTPAGVIGHQGKIPWRCPVDLKRFKALTMGKALVVGRKTAEGLPPLPGRRVIVLSRGARRYDCAVARSLEDALGAAGDGEVMIGGGGEIYCLALPRAETIYRTIVFADAEGDTWAPEIPAGWTCTSIEEGEGCCFEVWRREDTLLEFRLLKDEERERKP